eukprot:Gregarina_sp_Pseudo_9__2385@NODE_268_length_3344_cov_64_511952_g251_i0_p1_GENE_NODE_268_length_3344_cov_64_511952_g251_i0NODE_268_length_3344_cov_64_511952_g251_i0_p1_ORF_typecomplete_len520_score78_24Torus/PF16131_5/0_0056zfCCCH_3/PF15663_5/0_0076zfCCCH_4/PF18044_1/1zfCCCH/PF00642_24/2_7_NODE_268_length_3344_cov_64_511952_g251_i02961855
MSRTTTAASSARTNNLSFGWLLSQVEQTETATETETPNALWETDSVNLSALCRNTFLHLESASPLAKMSQSRMIRSFREFSSRLDHVLGSSTRPTCGNSSRRRHTLTPVVVDPASPSLPTRVEPNLATHRTDQTLGESPIARLSNRHAQTFGHCIKDDSFAPNIKQPLDLSHRTPSPSERISHMSMDPESAALSLLTGSSAASCTLPLVTRSLHSQNSVLSPIHHLPVTPTPVVSYFDNQGFFLPCELNQSDKDKVFNEDPAEEDCSSPTRSPTRLRPLADLLTEPWGNDGQGLSDLSSNNVTNSDAFSPPSTIPSPTTTQALSHPTSGHLSPVALPVSSDPPKEATFTPPGRVDCTGLSQAPTDFKLSEWAASLPEAEVSIKESVPGFMTQWSGNTRNKGSLSDLVHLTDCSELQNLFASAVAQAMLSGGAEEKKRAADAAKPGAEEVSGGHPNSCKPCAFFWSKGCLNGDKCRFCHEWHAPKKKKPMKDQKNLMIIAREDGRIAFLRCAIEDALRHQ